MSASLLFQIAITVVLAGTVGYVVFRGLPAAGWRRVVVVVALVSEAVLLPLRLVAHAESNRWASADEIQLAAGLAFAVIISLCAPTFRDRQAHRRQPVR